MTPNMYCFKYFCTQKSFFFISETYKAFPQVYPQLPVCSKGGGGRGGIGPKKFESCNKVCKLIPKYVLSNHKIKEDMSLK
jgi:hypothetical protein